MSYASRFTSNRFASLSEENANSTASQSTPSRTWDSSESSGRGTIFRRANHNEAPVHSAFQGMRNNTAVSADGFQQVGGAPRTNGYKSMFAKPEAPPAPKTFEDEFPSLGSGAPKRSSDVMSAPSQQQPKKTGFAALAKSWAKTAEEDAATAAAQEKQERIEKYVNDRDNAIYTRLIVNRRSNMPIEPEFDYNDEAPRNRDDDLDDNPYRGAGCAAAPPYSASLSHDYAEEVYDEDDE